MTSRLLLLAGSIVLALSGASCTSSTVATDETPNDPITLQSSQPPQTGAAGDTTSASGATAATSGDTAADDTSAGTTPEEPPPLAIRPDAPEVVRGLRVSRPVAASSDKYQALIELAKGSTVNALIFDTKDETGNVLYQSQVPQAEQLQSIEAVYDPAALVAEAVAEGLYPITRIVTFEDPIWSVDPDANLARTWVNAANSDNWEYPLALAVEACELGFAEIQFDYVRFPTGKAATDAAEIVPATSEERSAMIAGFLTEARERLQPLGCRTSAAVFGITMSSLDDQGIGQHLETILPTVDALSPMVYPSHYNSGWLGLDDPNEHPGPVVADALDDASKRRAALAAASSDAEAADPELAGSESDGTEANGTKADGAETLGTELRPWLQAFYYNGEQVKAQLVEADKRGAGWLLWNASGNYKAEWLPAKGE